MDVYLPNEFFELRGDLPDWSDMTPAVAAEHEPGLREENADPSWQTL